MRSSRPLEAKTFMLLLMEKAANLLYFVIKDHPFVDGNRLIVNLMTDGKAQ